MGTCCHYGEEPAVRVDLSIANNLDAEAYTMR